jgi:BASS family bile acid:Na+ symporter
MLAQLLAVALVMWLASTTNDNEQKIMWEGVLTCVIAPCAAAAPVVAGKLGGDLNTMTTYVLMSNVLSTLLIPASFAFLEPSTGVSFLSAFWVILQKVTLVLVFPLLLGYLIQQHLEPVRQWVVARKDLAFYCWSVALAMTTGVTVRNMLSAGASPALLLHIAILSLVVCWTQFGIGRAIGHRFGEKANTGQAMFQKNTGMAIWVAYLYLNPVASVGAGCYVLWQNIINSFELWQNRVRGFQGSEAKRSDK